MGNPAIPSASQRASTRALAREILDAVRNDERMPHGLEGSTRNDNRPRVLKDDVEDLLTRLAMEVVALKAEANEVSAGSHGFVGYDADCAMCGEGRQHYLHNTRKEQP